MSHKPYVREFEKTTWWLHRPRYLRYMAREITCFFIFAYTLLLVYGLKQLAAGPEAWAGFLECLTSPLSILFHILALVFSLYHTYTWFNLAPQSMPILIGEEFVPPEKLVLAEYAVFAVVSLIVLFLAGAF